MKLNLKIMYIVFIALFFAGCATFPKTSSEVYSGSSISDDPYTKLISVTSPRVSSGAVDAIILVAMKSYKDQNQHTTYSLLVVDYSENWIFYKSARDINGNVLDVRTMDRKVLGAGLIRESFCIFLSREYLDSASTSGMDIRLEGKRGSNKIFLPAYFIEGFLKKVDEQING